MPLTRFVKVGNITNLSDARYCAGMGVDLLGFRVIPGPENTMSIKQFQEVRGWITGPKIVAELYGMDTSTKIDSIIEDYRPDYLELGLNELPHITGATVPLIVSLPSTEIGSITSHPLLKNISHLLLTNFGTGVATPQGVTVLVEVTTVTALENIPEAYGIALNGSPEIRPGLKSYDELADVLEKLDSY
jgi:phosphoribosylanthranilate isomerase